MYCDSPRRPSSYQVTPNAALHSLTIWVTGDMDEVLLTCEVLHLLGAILWPIVTNEGHRDIMSCQKWTLAS